MRMDGAVEISGYDLAARCTVCRKTLAYTKSMSLGMWKAILRAFVKKHKECNV